MRISYNWLSEYLEKPLPEPEKLAEILTMHAFEVEGLEESGGDYIFEIDVLPNRTHDCLSYVGIAREVAVLSDNTLKTPESNFKTDSKLKTEDFISLLVEDNSLVKRAAKRLVIDVVVDESPDWLKEKLILMGQKPKNNIVDITNFVTFETGQPVHAFDYDKIAGDDKKEINIRKAKQGEKIKTLDGKEYELTSEMLVIADNEKALDIAGVKGGANSGIDKDTKKIVLSACNFHSTNIRKTSRGLGLLTDASKRFEQGISPELVEIAMDRLSGLVSEIAGGKVSDDVLDIYPNQRILYKVGVTAKQVNSLLGTNLKDKDVENTLTKLGFKYEKLVPAEYVAGQATKYLGRPYLFGATLSYDAPESFDCSSFVAFLYNQAGIIIPRISIDQFFFGEEIEEGDLKPGDLIFSQNGDVNYPQEDKKYLRTVSEDFCPGRLKTEKQIDHVGMYLGDGKVIHASGKWHKGEVVIEGLKESPAFKEIRGYRRVPGSRAERIVAEIPPERLDLMAIEGNFLASGTSADLIEEIGRVYGYENISEKMPKGDWEANIDKEFYYTNKIKDILVGEGFSEVLTYAFQNEGEVEVANPIASDKNYLRSSLVPGLKASLELNDKNKALLGLEKVKIFEIGTVFKSGEEYLELGVVGDRQAESALKIFEKELGVEIPTYGTDNVCLVNITELLSKLPEPKSYEDLNDIDTGGIKYKSISPYPFALRDIAFWTTGGEDKDDAEEVIRDEAGEWLVRADLFDEYEKDDRVSYAFHLVFQSQEKTLSDEEVNEVMVKIENKVKEKGWEVR